MKPLCPHGHEMALKDEKECYECVICDSIKEGERWWCHSCCNENNYRINCCLECAPDKGNHDHIIFNKTSK